MTITAIIEKGADGFNNSLVVAAATTTSALVIVARYKEQENFSQSQSIHVHFCVSHEFPFLKEQK